MVRGSEPAGRGGMTPSVDDPGEDGVIHFGLPRRLGDGHLFDPAGFVDAEGQFHAVFPVDAAGSGCRAWPGT